MRTDSQTSMHIRKVGLLTCKHKEIRSHYKYAIVIGLSDSFWRLFYLCKIFIQSPIAINVTGISIISALMRLILPSVFRIKTIR